MWGKLLIGVFIIAGIVWVGMAITTPPPGTKMENQGQEHVTAEEVAKYKYNSNPPTSGPHLPTWVKPGIYTEPQSEGELIHSLEHGYIVIHYNCNADQGKNMNTTQTASASATNGESDCKTLISQLEQIARKKKLFKMVVVPRPTLSNKIALAAWTYIDVFDAYDEQRIVKFIDYHRDHGPEQTME